MKPFISVLQFFILFFLLAVTGYLSHAESLLAWKNLQDTTKTDTLPQPYQSSKRPTYRPTYRFGDPFANRVSRSSLLLKDPSKIDFDVQFNKDTVLNEPTVSYSVYENIGKLNFRPTMSMSFEEYDNYIDSRINKEYFREKSIGLDGESAVSGRRLIPRLYFNPLFDRIFGGSYVDVQPNGFVNLDFGGRFQKIANPSLSLRQQRNGGFNFDQQINFSAIGKVGEKLSITFDFDRDRIFDFENNLKIEYTGYEEEIIKRIEIGNVSMPVTNSLMSGAQALFGIKTELQFGKLWVTSVLTQQKGRNETLNIQSGFQGKEFGIQAADYDENKHFFLGHFFRNNYERWLVSLPQITSGINVTRMEVYVLNRNNNTQTTRNIVALLDLGESERIFNSEIVATPNAPRGNPTRNNANNLFNQLTEYNVNQVENDIKGKFPSFVVSSDYVRINTARKLESSEYTINKELGYMSLLRRLQSDEILAVSYEYTYNGQAYKVGELTEDYQGRPDEEVIYLKMLRTNQVDTKLPSWDLMMKNIYSLNTSKIGREGFDLRVHYRDDATGLDNPSLHEGRLLKDKPLVEVFGLDRLNRNNDRQPDGNFDFIEGVTIHASTGLIIFPVIEPFGKTLRSQFDPETENRLIEKYVYNELYEETKVQAELNATKNKFVLLGRVSSGSTSEIKLPGINVAQGSVVVTAGNTILSEGTDYTVNYNIGTVRILNEGVLNSNKDISIAYEKADPFSFQTRTLTGTRFDYRFNDQFNIGTTILHLNERPGGIVRHEIGREPNSSTKVGFDINLQQEVRLLTKAIDFLPLISTKAPSKITFNAEFAQLFPGTSNTVNGVSMGFLDDFENVINTNNIGGWRSWKLAATPLEFLQNNQTGQGLENAYRRAKIAWYTIDNSIFYSNARPPNLTEADLENHYERAVIPQEIFRQRDFGQINANLDLFDIAYFPTERGQYNYNPQAASGTLPNPEQNWGGITRAINTEVNFNNTNIEYLEFWLMDPFVSGERGKVLDGNVNENNTTGGELIFNLGNVSEDLAPDNRHAFEHGLPTDGSPVTQEEVTTWGQITDQQILTRYFANTPGARDHQDIGLDGLRDEEEKEILIKNGLPENTFEGNDISADNFTHALDASYDNRNAKIVERYKQWNGMEKNSPIASTSNQNFIPASSTLPDNEDLNEDNTISNLEEYFEYRIPLQYDPKTEGGNLQLNKYVVDQISNFNGEANWYLFRIPLKNEGTLRGTPSFENIKYIRMYLTQWKQPVVLRTARMRFVGSREWRKYENTLIAPGLNEIPNVENDDFDMSVVSIEENSTRTAGGSPYVLPPGTNRDVDNSSTLTRRINEHSLQICVEDLNDKDAKAVYKNVSLDLINYGRLKMFFHAQSHKNDIVVDDEITAFIRLGTDFEENYYEIEVKMKVTPPDVSGSIEQVRRLVWPLENEIDVSLTELLGIKSERNRTGFNETTPYTVPSNDGKYNFTVKGRPDMSRVQILMIGVRNPKDPIASSKSVCIWANELRVTDFDKKAGWAANARLNAQLADLGTFSASTRYTAIGFGTIQQKISERARAETFQYDLSTNLNLGKFLLPEKTGIVLPMYASYEKSVTTPQFDPLDPDVPLESSIERINDAQDKENYRKIAEDRRESRSLNFTNIRKQKVNSNASKRIYDIENLSLSYAYSDRNVSNFSTQQLFTKSVSTGVNYNFSPSGQTSVTPLENVKILSSPYLALIKDFNFSYFPSNLSFSSNLKRDFKITQYYNRNLTIEGVRPLYEKLFIFNRNYSLRWDLASSLNFNYSAKTNAVIDEPEEFVEGDITTQSERQFIWEQIKKLGRTKNFSQDITLNYQLPFSKIPFTQWINSDVRYSIGYGWVAGSINQPDGQNQVADSLYFGNFINNTKTIAINSKINMSTIYDKITVLKNANAPPPEGEKKTVSQNILSFLTLLKSVNAAYNIQRGTKLSGYEPQPVFFGLDGSLNAPGINFILGSQNPDIRTKAALNGWLVNNENLNSPFTQNHNTKLTIQAEVQPLPDVRMQMNWNRGINNQYQEIYRFDTNNGAFETLTPSRSGSYTASFLSIASAFGDGKDLLNSKNFAVFEQNLVSIRERLNRTNPNGTYDTLTQDVMIPAFIAAYSKKSIEKIALTPFPKIPLPNWRIDYSGLNKIPELSEIFSSITLNHAYNSTYNVSNFTNSLNYGNEIIGLQNNVLDYPQAGQNETGALTPVYIISQVMISEQFSPLIGVNVKTVSNLSVRTEIKRSRTLALNMSNAQVTETKANEFSIEIGFNKKGLKLPWRVQRRVITLKNDIAFRMTTAWKNSETIQRKVNDEDVITNGNTTLQIRPTVTYKIIEQLDLSMYFERNVTNPKVLSAYRRTTTAFGIQIRLNLAQL